MLDVLGLQQPIKEAITDSYEALKQKFDCRLDNDDLENFANKTTGFRLLGEFRTKSLKNIFKINDNGTEFYLLCYYLTEIHYNLKSNVFLYGFSTLNRPKGDFVIQPMEFTDKWFGLGKKGGEVLKRHDTKNKFKLLPYDKSGSKPELSDGFYKELFQIKDINVEFCDNIFLCGFQQDITAANAIALAEATSKLVKQLC